MTAQTVTLRLSPELHRALGRATFEKNISQNAIGILALELWIKENCGNSVYLEYLKSIEEKHRNCK